MFISFVFSYLKDNKTILLLKWPTQSPDLNPMEYIWLPNKKKIQCQFYAFKLVDKLYDKIRKIWFYLSWKIIVYVIKLCSWFPKQVRWVRQVPKKAVIIGKSNIFRFNHFSKLKYTTLLRCLWVEFVWKIKWFVVVRLKVVSCFSCINCI